MSNRLPVPDRRLALMQLSDSLFPSGSFTLSHGLESLIHSGQIQSADDFQECVCYCTTKLVHQI